jgi:hypothetical protein
MNPSAVIIPEGIKSIHKTAPKAGVIQKAVDRGDESHESLRIKHSFKMQTVGKCVRSP